MSSEVPDVQLLRLARNQTVFREVNERFAKLATEFAGDGSLGFVCECSDTECVSQIGLSRDEFRHVRSVPTWFAIKPGHEIPEIEDIVAVTERYAIVAKREAAADVAVATDQRRTA